MYTISRAILEDAPIMLDLQRRAFAEEGRRSGSQDIPPLTELLDAVIEHIQTQTALVAKDRERSWEQFVASSKVRYVMCARSRLTLQIRVTV